MFIISQIHMEVPTAEVIGTVSSVAFGRPNEATKFRIHCPNMGKTFDAICSFYSPFRQGDTIYAFCAVDKQLVLHLLSPPFVQPPIDKDSMLQCFMRAIKCSYRDSLRLYSAISRSANGDENVISYLSDLAQKWCDTYNPDILAMFKTEPDEAKKLLSWWHRERNLRRLYLLGLTKKEINACRMKCYTI